jgi:LPXTG-motif cell wall-anchored protein
MASSRALGGVLVLASCVGMLPMRLHAAEGPPDPIYPGMPCEPHRCECGGLDLSQFKGRVFDTPPDAQGMRVRFKMCENLTVEELPEGCHGNWVQAPSSVLYNASNGLTCDQIGSFGPCKSEEGGRPMQCGMTFNDSRADGGELLVAWQLEYGCINTFRVALSAGTDMDPEEVVAHDPDSCYWHTHWAGYRVPPTPPPPPPPPPLPDQSSSTPLIAAIGVLLVMALGVGMWLWRRKRRNNGEQLLAEPTSVAYSRDGGSWGAE